MARRQPERPATANAATIRGIYECLLAAYGPQHWWPADTPTEMVIGAILTQNTAWTNVERAIQNLRQAGCLTLAALRRTPDEKLARLIQPSGTYRVKAARLRAFVEHVWGHFDGSLDAMLTGELGVVRRRLLGIHGIGPETADCILLYAGGHPSFVVDAYTKRILRRHFLIAPTAGYDEIRDLFHAALTPDPVVFNEYHALLVAVGKDHCRAKAVCEDCPLEHLPHDE